MRRRQRRPWQVCAGGKPFAIVSAYTETDALDALQIRASETGIAMPPGPYTIRDASEIRQVGDPNGAEVAYRSSDGFFVVMDRLADERDLRRSLGAAAAQPISPETQAQVDERRLADERDAAIIREAGRPPSGRA